MGIFSSSGPHALSGSHAFRRPGRSVNRLCKALASRGTETLLAWVSPATQGLPVNQCTDGESGLRHRERERERGGGEGTAGGKD